MSAPKEYLSLEEVADMLGVNYQLIYKLVRSGELPAARLGRIYRVLRRDLDHFLEKSKTFNSTGGICSSCGGTFHSRLSLRYACTECGDAICADCWDRRHVRTCKEHTPPPAGKPGRR